MRALHVYHVYHAPGSVIGQAKYTKARRQCTVYIHNPNWYTVPGPVLCILCISIYRSTVATSIYHHVQGPVRGPRHAHVRSLHSVLDRVARVHHRLRRANQQQPALLWVARRHAHVQRADRRAFHPRDRRVRNPCSCGIGCP